MSKRESLETASKSWKRSKSDDGESAEEYQSGDESTGGDIPQTRAEFEQLLADIVRRLIKAEENLERAQKEFGGILLLSLADPQKAEDAIDKIKTLLPSEHVAQSEMIRRLRPFATDKVGARWLVETALDEDAIISHALKLFDIDVRFTVKRFALVV